ncbi:MAG: prepilin-type N-terminal cleavage/methylation domain-containing protein [Candidatus Gracilibacteria bacterium]
MKKQGFTLVEMIVVMGIIALLSVMSVAGYMSYRKSALVHLAGDDFKSQVDELRTQVLYGKFGVDGPKCLGFEVANGEAKIFEENFSDKKAWEGEGFVSGECGDEKVEKGGFVLDQNVRILSSEPGIFEVRFVPPDAKSVGDKNLKMILQYGPEEDERYQSEVNLNFN